jgi:hypothetical protein
MIIYSVKVNIKKSVESGWLDWMLNYHIKDVMETGHFNQWKIFRVLNSSDKIDDSTYIIEYFADSIENYEAYLKNDSRRLQEEHLKKFGGYFSAERSVRELISLA